VQEFSPPAVLAPFVDRFWYRGADPEEPAGPALGAAGSKSPSRGLILP
jgi:hypothetical protein